MVTAGAVPPGYADSDAYRAGAVEELSPATMSWPAFVQTKIQRADETSSKGIEVIATL